METRDIVATALTALGWLTLTCGVALVAAWLALVVLGVGMVAFGIAVGRTD